MVQNGSRDPWKGLGQIWIPSSTLEWVGRNGVVWDGLGDPRGGSGRIVGPSGWSGMGWGTLEDFRDGSGTLGEVRDG